MRRDGNPGIAKKVLIALAMAVTLGWLAALVLTLAPALFQSVP